MNIKSGFVSIAAFLVLCAPVFAQGLDGLIYVSNQIENFEEEKIVREYVIGETAYCAILVQGFSVDDALSVNITADLKFIDPDGNIVFEERNYARVKKTVADDEKGLVLDSSFDVKFNENDPVGMYTLEVLIKDHVNNSENKTTTTLLLFDTAVSKEIIMTPVTTGGQLDVLWAEYFRSRNPWAIKRIISALKLGKESSSAEDAAVGFAARESLVFNGKRDAAVLKICKDTLSYTSGSTNELLKEVLSAMESSPN